MSGVEVYIEIGNLQFDFVHKIEIETGWAKMTDTCTIHLPQKLTLKKQALKDMIKRGDRVKVRYGYVGYVNTEFEGFVLSVQPTTPITIHCEDRMFIFKTGQYSLSKSSASLKEVIATFWKGDVKQVGEVALGAVRYDKLTPAKILETKLKDQYGMYSFFRGAVLVTGLMYDTQTAMKHFFTLTKDVEKSNLEFRNKDDVRIKVKATNIEMDNSRISVTAGDDDGEERTLHYTGFLSKYDKLTAKKMLREAAERDLLRYKYTGFKGSITVFGIPTVQHGDVVQITDPDFPDRNGSYWVDKVKKTFGMDGIRQEVELGPIVNG